jgi:transcriptional regulator with XRE-family HTH domain
MDGDSDRHVKAVQAARVARADRDRARVVGARIRSRRRCLGLSQEELGERSGMHRTYVGQIERGEVMAGWAKLVDIAAALNVEVGTLMTDHSEAS